jgi:Tfp pilus assembly protein PilV
MITQHQHSRRTRRGATLVELLVALLLFDMSLLSLAAVNAVAVRRTGEASRRSRAIVSASSRIESMLVVACAQQVAGSAMVERGVSEYWTSQPIYLGIEIVDSIRIESRAPESIVLRARRLC